MLKETLSLFDRAEKLELALVFVIVLTVATLEVVGIASILPFLTVVSNPEMIHEQYVLRYLWGLLEPSDHNSFLFTLGLIVFGLIILTNLFNAVSHWLIQRFIWLRHHSLSTRLLDRYIRQRWEFFLNRNTSELSTNILSEVQQFVGQFLMAGIQLLAQGLAGVLIVGLLVAIDPTLAVIVSAVVGGTYMLIFVAVRATQIKLGHIRTSSNTARYRHATEAMSGMKDLKILGLEEAFLRKYEGPSYRYSMAQAKNAVIAITPRYFLEVLGFGAVMLILLYELRQQGTASNAIPVVGVYAFAGFRLLPKMQQMFYSGSSMRFTAETLSGLKRDLVELQRSEEPAPVHVSAPIESFGLRNVTFNYPEMGEPTLKNVNIEIATLSSVALVGPTGSGKTTTVDLLLGLLEPTSGGLVLDGNLLSASERIGWRSHCGYVPQQIYLTDDTIAGNIAFGESADEWSMERIKKAAQIAQIDEFIEQELPEGYLTVVGERGVRLSGGQRQRLGIARALYNDPEILVFDEATSALDNTTERAIMDAIEQLAGTKTLVVIAHRLETVRKCDIIFVFEKGELIDSGCWDELLSNCDVFRSMVSEDSMGKGRKPNQTATP
ncbi:ABC transporter ATP-binding protein [Microvenator marinus]|uniref:ABC transporter ATP-binding protein n=1 Tax=Microvenator marinus TaxID=2600177 RepID=UPI00201B5FEE|nr:ABC transporter ATP-binding protein [Microvenator marinus]